MVTVAHPILPLYVQEATWLVRLPDHMLTTLQSPTDDQLLVM